MKLSIVIIALALIGQVLSAPAEPDFASSTRLSVIPPPPPSTYPPSTTEKTTVLCRHFQGPSRCVDEPVRFPDKEPWCPYRVCGPSYVPAERCPAVKELQATAKCHEEEITRDVYKCDGKGFGSMYLPRNCAPGTDGCHDTPVCSCVKVDSVTTKIYVEHTPFMPDCSMQG